MQAISVAVLLLLLAGGRVFAVEAKPPTISIATVEWDTARAALTNSKAARRLSTSAHAAGTAPNLLTQLNRASGTVFPNIAASPVPVLLPFDLDAFLQNKAGDEVDYLAGFGKPKFFLAGPAGYSAAYSVSLDTGSKSRDVEIDVSGFALLYDLEDRKGGEEKPLMGLQTDFPGIRRFYFEHHMRYLFPRHGVLYDVSVECYDGSIHSNRRLSCQDAHGLAVRLLKALNIAGGTPQAIPAVEVKPEQARPQQKSAAFSYYPPGQLISGTSARRSGGDVDYTVYAAMRFPLADGPVQTYSQMFINLGDCTAALGDSQTVRRNGAPFRCKPGKQLTAEEMPNGGQNMYPWRDNFCESRAYLVGQCPSGIGHQGQDMVPVGCALSSQNSEPCDRSHHRIVAVHDGVVLRAPKQEGLVVVANAPGTHLRFRYLHMNPNAVDEDGFFSGRAVSKGEIIGKVSNFAGRKAGTSYHLHFDMQVPTKDGWVFVNPYMTLVTAYEQLVGGRGGEIEEGLAQAASAEAVAVPPEYKAPRKSQRKPVRKKRLAAHNR